MLSLAVSQEPRPHCSAASRHDSPTVVTDWSSEHRSRNTNRTAFALRRLPHLWVDAHAFTEVIVFLALSMGRIGGLSPTNLFASSMHNRHQPQIRSSFSSLIRRRNDSPPG